MANFEIALKSVLTNKMSIHEYQGIQRKYFPKWKGWDIVDNNLSVPFEVVTGFYKEFFWDKLNLHALESQELANLILLFSTCSGKKKSISKLARVTGIQSQEVTQEVIQELNSRDYFLDTYAEIVEFFIITNTHKNLNKFLNVYYNYINSRL